MIRKLALALAAAGLTIGATAAVAAPADAAPTVKMKKDTGWDW